jgi:excisionase family DNA binding protein
MSITVFVVREVAAILQVSKSKVYSEIRKGNLIAFHRSGQTRILPEHLNHYIQAHRTVDSGASIASKPITYCPGENS